MRISLTVIIIYLMAGAKVIETTTDHPPSNQGKEPQDHGHPNQAMIGGLVGGLALLVTLVVVLIVVRHKLPWTQVCCAAGGASEQRANSGHNAEGNHYEEIQIQMQNQQASSGALPSVYATVNPPADQLHYASVGFQKDSVGVSTGGKALPDATKNGSPACDYSSISKTQGANYPPAAEQTLYTTVTKAGEP